MEQLAWSDALKTDIEVIDRQHRGLVDMVNASAQRLAEDSALSGEEVRLLLGYLKDYAEVHFSTEEALMALCGVPSDYVQNHHHNHMRFLSYVEDMIDGVGQNAVLDGQQLLAFLGDWLIRHIQGEDQRLAKHLRAPSKTSLRAVVTESSPAEHSVTSTCRFTDMLMQGSEALHASEEDASALLEQGSQAAMLIALDAALLPKEVLRVNEEAASLFGCSAEQLRLYSADSLLGAPGANALPLLMAEVLMQGRFVGPLACVGPDGQTITSDVRIALLMSHGRMTILVVFGVAAAPSSAPETAISTDTTVDDARDFPHSGSSSASGDSLLSRHALFRSMSRNERIKLEQLSQLISLPKGEVLFDQGDKPQGLYMVISGQMSLIVRREGGEEKVLEIVHAPQIFAEAEVFARRPSPVSAQSLSSTVLLMIPAAELLRIQSSSNLFACAVVEHLGKRLHDFTAEIQALTLHTAMERIIDYMLEHAHIDTEGVLEVSLPTQKKVMASYLNLRPATLSRAFQQLVDTGLITINRSLVTIPDRARLANYRERVGKDRLCSA